MNNLNPDNKSISKSSLSILWEEKAQQDRDLFVVLDDSKIRFSACLN